MATLEVLEQQINFIREQIIEIKDSRDDIIREASRNKDLLVSMDKSLAVFESALKDISKVCISLQESIKSNNSSVRYWLSYVITTIISIIAIIIVLSNR